MNKAPIETARDADLQRSLAAMQRAAQRAHEVARSTGTALVVSRGSVIVHLGPDVPELVTHGVQDTEEEMGSE